MLALLASRAVEMPDICDGPRDGGFMRFSMPAPLEEIKVAVQTKLQYCPTPLFLVFSGMVT
jgi:hypothetical protein